ncbi:hypothetical protein M441DRAFT_452615 [Trichoderma asperellum CBS 433.97]|uniref:Uncharacterized protein n=1 Tax=Trichoderma asperellum (strain ATCC 204424 / CBS 433.97 / NBRC 101777) TaxID=1042311 RepID=A0A2T3YRV2_TRIA4|nr:hypothetical protein M441DRAFT_452615 [Trichoderma asperellum CBS 433.97]PTB35298.1 hypothetical protein M441DRAFT_452615 [Trichoderma asperellum CBS 433.97]
MPSARTDTKAQRALRDSAAKVRVSDLGVQSLLSVELLVGAGTRDSVLVPRLCARPCATLLAPRVPATWPPSSYSVPVCHGAAVPPPALALAGRSGAACPVVPCASSAGWDAGQWTRWAPHHPQCRCWQVLVPSDAAHPPVHFDALPRPAGWYSLFIRPLVASASPASALLLHYFYFHFIAPSSSFPLPLPVKGLLSPRSLRLVSLVLRTPISDSSAQSPRLVAIANSSARFATSTINPRKPAAIRTSSAPTQPIPSPNSSTRERRVLLCLDPCSGPPQLSFFEQRRLVAHRQSPASVYLSLLRRKLVL